MPLISQIVFDKHDRDGSGTIDASELREIAYSLGHPMTQEQIDAGLKSIDQNGDGSLTYDEFKKWWAQKDRFSALADETDAATAQAHAEWVNAVVGHFRYFDKSKDQSGTIDRKEFAALYQNLQESGRYNLSSKEDAMAQLDANSDGVITLEEYMDWLRKGQSS